MAFTPIILTHVLAACGALMIGGITLSLRKGTTLHRVFGRVWVGLMLIATLVSFGIKRSGDFSSIHLLSVVALAGLAASIYAVSTGNIRAHRRGMIAVYMSLVVAGIFTLLPHRRLGNLVWNAIGLI